MRAPSRDTQRMEDKLFDLRPERQSGASDASAAEATRRPGGPRSRSEPGTARPPSEVERSDEAGRPLAVRMRPHALEQFVGQRHLLAEGSALRAAIEQGRPHSIVLYGPPGSGKTTLARMLAEDGAPAGAGRAGEGRTILFLDEIHRFNKAQQDALLPAVEDGLVTLI